MLIDARRYAFQLSNGEVITWPERTAIDIFNQQPVMGLVRFHDSEAYHPPLGDYLSECITDEGDSERLVGGARLIKDLLDWDLAEAELITTRALKLCMDMMHSERCRIASAYALVLSENAFLPPQAPGNAIASVVYLLDPGDADPASSNGRLSFTHRHINGLAVQAPARLSEGTMIAHPADMRLAALPYTGQRPRILLNWHIIA